MASRPTMSLLIPALLLLSPASAPAAGAGYYSATFAAPVDRTQMVAKDLLWSCTGDACTASASNSRPAIICSTLAKTIGPVTAFSAGSAIFDAHALQKCNAKAS